MNEYSIHGEKTEIDLVRVQLAFEKNIFMVVTSMCPLSSVESPKISAPSDVTVNVGENFTLTCTASGLPTPTVKWQKDGQDYGEPVSVPKH